MSYIQVSERSKLYELARRKLSRHRFTLDDIFDPVRGHSREVLSYGGKIVAQKEDLDSVMKHFVIQSKGDGSRKLAYLIGCHYAGRTACISLHYFNYVAE